MISLTCMVSHSSRGQSCGRARVPLRVLLETLLAGRRAEEIGFPSIFGRIGSFRRSHRRAANRIFVHNSIRSADSDKESSSHYQITIRRGGRFPIDVGMW